MFIKKEMQRNDLNRIKNVRVKLLPEIEAAIWCRSAIPFLIYKNNYNSTYVRPKLPITWDIDSSIVVDWFNTISGTATTNLFPGVNINGCFYMNVWTLM